MKFRILWLMISLFLLANPGMADEEFFATIKNIARKEVDKFVEIEDSTATVQHSPYNSNSWHKSIRKMPLQKGDIIYLTSENIFTELEIRSQKGKGKFTYWADSIRGESTFGKGFEIKENPEDLGSFFAFVHWGKVWLEKIQGKIVAKSGATEVIATGTKFYIDVAQDSTTTVFVKEGIVTLNSNTQETLHLFDNESARVTMDGHIEKLALTPAAVETMLHMLKSNPQRFLGALKPFWQKPLFYYLVPSAVAAASTAAYIVTKDDEQKRASGTITVQIPD